MEIVNIAFKKLSSKIDLFNREVDDEYKIDYSYINIKLIKSMTVGHIMRILKQLLNQINTISFKKLWSWYEIKHLVEISNGITYLLKYYHYLPLKEKWEITIFEMMIIGKYLESNIDFINLMKSCKKYQSLTSRYHFNPIDEISLFPKMQTQHFYKNSEQKKKKGMIKYIYWCDIDYYRYLSRSSNEEFKKVCDFSIVIKRAKNEHIESCIIPEGVTSIQNKCFYYYEYLTRIILPTTLKNIGESSFEFTNIKCVIIPNGVTSIGDKCFIDCRSLSRVLLPSTLIKMGKRALESTKIENMVIPESVSTISDGCFRNCTKLSSIQLPSTLERIGSDAFGCSGLREIKIPETVTYIGKSVFYYCKRMKKMTISTQLLTNENNDHFSCSGIEEIIIPEGITSIRKKFLFKSFKHLKTVKLPSTIKTIGACAFFFSRIINITIPEGVTSIGNCCFYDCTRLTQIQLPSTLLEIGKNAFFGSDINSIVIPEQVTSIGYNIFGECVSLKAIVNLSNVIIEPRTLKPMYSHEIISF